MRLTAHASKVVLAAGVVKNGVLAHWPPIDLCVLSSSGQPAALDVEVTVPCMPNEATVTVSGQHF